MRPAATFDLIDKTLIAPLVTKYVVRAPEIARRRRAGQFVIVRLREHSERIPLTIADADPLRGTITLIVKEVGKSTGEMARDLGVGDGFRDVAGPLGMPTHLEKVGRVVAVGGGIGIAPLHPIAQGLRAAGNTVCGILGARSHADLILEEEMRRACDEIRIVTDDGSYGEQGFVTDALRRVVAESGPPALCVAIGPLVMMRAVSEVTRGLGIRTLVSLNPVMVDGTGMCGGCRVTVHGETKFACVDGPEFDAHGVDFEELARRQRFYGAQERASYAEFQRARPHESCHAQRGGQE
jgi:ferredoxin--NADP+ reductase